MSAQTADLKTRVDRTRWWHTIDLGGGIVTPGASDNLNTLPKLGLPERLDGKTVLDIGAWDGFFSFEAERRGAARVLATDSFAWGGRDGDRRRVSNSPVRLFTRWWRT